MPERGCDDSSQLMPRSSPRRGSLPAVLARSANHFPVFYVLPERLPTKDPAPGAISGQRTEWKHRYGWSQARMSLRRIPVRFWLLY